MSTLKPDVVARLFISYIEVVYGDEPSQEPSNRVRELTGLSDDINYQFGGKYVWLVPHYVSEPSSAVTGFEIVIQGSADPTQSDLAKGAGGDYRYLLLTRDITQDAKATNVVLLRSDSSIGVIPQGWDGTTIDINKGRGKTYLYLLWKVAS